MRQYRFEWFYIQMEFLLFLFFGGGWGLGWLINNDEIQSIIITYILILNSQLHQLTS